MFTNVYYFLFLPNSCPSCWSFWLVVVLSLWELLADWGLPMFWIRVLGKKWKMNDHFMASWWILTLSFMIDHSKITLNHGSIHTHSCMTFIWKFILLWSLITHHSSLITHQSIFFKTLKITTFKNIKNHKNLKLGLSIFNNYFYWKIGRNIRYSFIFPKSYRLIYNQINIELFEVLPLESSSNTFASLNLTDV